MRILINYEKTEQGHLSVLRYFAKSAGFDSIFATSSVLSMNELFIKAKSLQCAGIFLCNAATLANLVPYSKPAPTLDDWRGSLLQFSIPCVIGNNFLHVQTITHGAWLLKKDLWKLRNAISGFDAPAFDYTVLDEIGAFESAARNLEGAEFLAYDIETKTFPPTQIGGRKEIGPTFITCCSWTAVYADRSLKTCVLPLIDFTENHWYSNQEYEKAIAFMRRINGLSIPKAMHNGMYDCIHSIIYRAYPMNWTLDTMAMAHAEFSELPKKLDFVASIILPDYCQWKNEAATAHRQKDINKYWAYNAKDTWTTARICLHYLDKLPAYARKNYAIQFPLVYPSLYCNMEGIKIDQNKRKEIKEKEESKLEFSLKELKILLADPDFNPSSPKQVQKYIYDILGAKDPRIGMKKTAKGTKVKIEKGTSEKNLLQIGQQHPILARVTSAIISYREARKAISTYMDFVQKNGRLYYALNPFGTETGRMACVASSLWCGTQVQNIPSYAKSMLVADDGYEMMEIDNSQSEARCTAYLAQEKSLIAALETPGKDFYTSLGTLFFGIPYEQVTKELRNSVLKKIVHGTNYMMGAATFIEVIGVEKLIFAAKSLGVQLAFGKERPSEQKMTLAQFAAHLLNSYHKSFSNVRKWYDKIANEIISTSKLQSPLGHTRYFFGNVEKNNRILVSAVAHAPQNLSVSILNIGFWKVWELVKKYNGDLRLKAQVHDSVLCQYKIGRTDIRKQVLKALDNPVTVHGRILRIPTDAKVGNSWGEMNAVKIEK